MTRAAVSGKVVFITGPARGIGEEMARQLAARGARLALAGLEPARLAALAASLGDGHAWFTCDVTDQPALDRAVAATMARFGRIDIVIANAGIASSGTVAVTPVQAMVRTIDVNLSGVVRTVSATLPHVTAARGFYLFVSSAAAFAPMPGIATYSATKSGVEAFANALRGELLHKGVGVGVAHPSWIDTDMVRSAQRDLQSFSKTLKSLPGPLGTVTPVAECAAAIVAAIEHRRRTVYIPRSLGALAQIRQLLGSPFAEWLVGMRTRRTLPLMEREVKAIGRSFGEHSMALGATVDEAAPPAAEAHPHPPG